MSEEITGLGIQSSLFNMPGDSEFLTKTIAFWLQISTHFSLSSGQLHAMEWETMEEYRYGWVDTLMRVVSRLHSSCAC